MTAFATTLNAVLPAFLLIVVGALAGRLFPALELATLNRLTVYFMIPALVFDAIATTTLGLADAGLLAAGYLLYLLLLCLVSLVVARGLTPLEQRGLISTSLFGNSGNMGLPITLFAYGQAGLERAVVIFVLSLFLMFAFGPLMLSGGGESMAARVRETLKLPPLWASLVGLLVNVTGLAIPAGLGRGITLLGDAAIPVMLLALGVQVYRSWTWRVSDFVARAATLRLIVGPLVAYLAGLLLGIRGLDLSVLVLSAAMPVAVTMFVVALEVKGDVDGIARTVVATTIGSLAAIAAVILLLPG